MPFLLLLLLVVVVVGVALVAGGGNGDKGRDGDRPGDRVEVDGLIDGMGLVRAVSLGLSCGDLWQSQTSRMASAVNASTLAVVVVALCSWFLPFRLLFIPCPGKGGEKNNEKENRPILNYSVQFARSAVLTTRTKFGPRLRLPTVDGGHRAIVFNRLSGVKENVMAEGMHFVIPWFEWPYIYDVRTKPRNVQVRALVAKFRTVVLLVHIVLSLARVELIHLRGKHDRRCRPTHVRKGTNNFFDLSCEK